MKLITTLAAAGFCLAAIGAAFAQRAALPDQPRPQIGKMDDSIKSYEDAVKYYKAGDLERSRQELETFLGKVGEHAGGNFLMGMVLAQQGDLAKSKIYFANAVKFDPKMVSARGWLGAVNAALGDFPGAQAQRDALAQMDQDCAGKCPRAADIKEGLDRIDQNIAANKKT